jgi:hypothetical protein
VTEFKSINKFSYHKYSATDKKYDYN